MSTTVLETERLILRLPELGDLDSLAALYGDAETMRYIGAGVPLDREATAKRLAAMLANAAKEWSAEKLAQFAELALASERDDLHCGLWMMIEKRSRRFVGRAGLLTWNLDGAPELEVGYMVAREHWGRGLATEAALAIRDYAFDRLGSRRLVSLIRPENRASQNVAAKLGFALEKTLRIDDREAQVYVGRRG